MTSVAFLITLGLFFTPKLWAGNLQTATLAAGCFWGSEEFFRKVPGVVETQVGYTGGSDKATTYEEVSSGTTDNAESVEIKFDPDKVSYKEILTLFFKMHDPTTLNQQINDKGTQYRSAVFFHDKEQEKVAIELMKKIEKSGAWKKKLTTEVKPAGMFHRAEEEHQKYLVKHKGGYDNHYLRDLKF